MIDIRANPGSDRLQQMLRVGQLMKERYNARRRSQSVGHGTMGPSSESSSTHLDTSESESDALHETLTSKAHPWFSAENAFTQQDSDYDSDDNDNFALNSKMDLEKGDAPFASSRSQCKMSILYGACLNVLQGHEITITGEFSLSRLHTILDDHSQDYPGLKTPYLYVGTTHSTAAFHIEDAAVWSVNFLHYGAAKVWIVIPPKYYGYFVKCLKATQLPQAHTCCINVLGHKVVMVDTVFLKSNEIPFTVIVQQPGEFVFVDPMAPHFVFNAGPNIAEAINFASESWIFKGVYAPDCDCMEDTIHLDMTPFLAMFKPELLEPYMKGHLYKIQTSEHLTNGMEVVQTLTDFKVVSSKDPSTEVANTPSRCEEDIDDEWDRLSVCEERKPSKKTPKLLQCLFCTKVYIGGLGALPRLLKHCSKKHGDQDKPEELTKEKYPAREVRQKKNKQCVICGKLFAGGPAHLKRHIERWHEPMEEAED